MNPLSSIPPDLKQNIFYMVLFFVTHNFLAIFFGMGILISALILIVKPSRWSVLLLFGFILLLVGFEYNKHIVEPLREQTINSLITVQEHNKVRRIVNFVLVRAMPRLLLLTGALMVFAGILLRLITGTRKKSSKN